MPSSLVNQTDFSNPLGCGRIIKDGRSLQAALKWGHRTVIGECVANLSKSRVGEIIVVLGHREAKSGPFSRVRRRVCDQQ
jgi:hypothetical protein